ncbi:MAG: matrixin family metalloprotease [Planctomycetota bacterium]|jgi:hypothetical protein
MSRKVFRLTVLVLVIAAILTLAYPSWAKRGAKGKDRVLSKITFIHFKKAPARPPWAGGGGGKEEEEEGVYGYIAKGAKWKTEADILLNPIFDENPDGSLDSLVIDATTTGLTEWETADGANLQIFGDIFIDETVTYADGARRGYNTITFGPYTNPGVIGITTVWGYFTGPPRQREIIETHLLLNDDLEWGDAAIDPALMDIQNILTHELGHCAGMGDIYEAGGVKETMYGYSEEGETNKRDLYFGDIKGITELYK